MWIREKSILDVGEKRELLFELFITKCTKAWNPEATWCLKHLPRNNCTMIQVVPKIFPCCMTHPASVTILLSCTFFIAGKKKLNWMKVHFIKARQQYCKWLDKNYNKAFHSSWFWFLAHCFYSGLLNSGGGSPQSSVLSLQSSLVSQKQVDLPSADFFTAGA